MMRFLLILALAMHSCAWAQFIPAATDVRVSRMGYSNTSGEKGLTVFHYRRDGVMEASTWMLEDNSRHSANYFAYDDAGRMLEKYREFSDGLTSTDTYEYDAAGHRLKETFMRSDGVGGYAEYQWSGEGVLLAAECDKYKGWFTGHIEYEYENGLKLSARISREGEYIGKIEYDYETTGRLASETWDFNSKWSQTFTYAYEPVPGIVYSASSPLNMMNPAYRVVAEDYDFNSTGGGPSRYVYDEKGRLEKKIYERSDGLKTETTYLFNDLGDLVSSHRAYHDGRSADFAYEYDAAGRLVAKTFEVSTGQTGFERYSYDRLGRLQTAVYRNMDFWLNGLLTFHYDDWGHLQSGHFASDGGDDAEIDIKTDPHGNVVRIQWLFTNGKTQTYTFDYDLALKTVGEIAATVVEQLKVNLLGPAPQASATDPEAYALFLQARYLRRQMSAESREQAKDL